MRLSASPRHFRGLVIAPVLATMLAFPANAQTSSDPETQSTGTAGAAVSHGCVRISLENAATLYALVENNGLENTEVVLTGVTPGGEFKVARPAAPRYSQASPGWYEPNKY